VLPIYDRNTTAQELRQSIPAYLYNYYKKENVEFGNGKTEEYLKWKTIKVDCELWLEELRIEATIRGVKFVQTKFNNLDDILSLKEQYVYNCSGYSSKQLFNDNNVTEIVDHLILFKNTHKLSYSLSATLPSNLKIRVNCFGDRVVLRSETTLENSNDEFVKNLVKETQAFFEERSVKAKL
jgi:hypothetical protein